MTNLERSLIQDPSKVAEKSIKQIVGFFGNGQLTDKGSAAWAFRDFLNNCEISQLRTYASELLSDSSDGKIFQDIVNTLGKKLSFEVEHGLYQGRADAIGHDGLWSLGDLKIVIECKTSDAFRISTEVLLKYSEKIKKQKGLRLEPPVLLVVGRIDTGDLESQIRGSRADDRISIIGVESLLDLAEVAASLSGGPGTGSLSRVLLPKDYTRLDVLTALITNVINEIQQTSLDLSETIAQKIPSDTIIDGEDWRVRIRGTMINNVSKELGKLQRVSSRSKAQYVTKRGKMYYFLTSKRYTRSDQQFWYSIQCKWKAVWEQNGGGLALGLEGKQEFYFINCSQVLAWVKFLNETKNSKRHYWHMALKEKSDGMELILNKAVSNHDLTGFMRSFDKKI